MGNRSFVLIIYFIVAIIWFGLFSCENRENKIKAAEADLSELVENISHDVDLISKEVESLARFTEGVYGNADQILSEVDRTKYRIAENGAFYKAVDDGRSALWVSGYFTISEEVKKIAYFTEALDPELERIVREIPEVVQAYYNDMNCLNRIYPPFDILAQYEPKMNITAFNFYYLADAEHNPEHKAVWVNEPYVDPAGRGWMVSAIAPVYVHGQMVGVPGLDVTINTITERYILPDSNNIMLVDHRGVVVSSDEYLINLFGLPSLVNHKYLTTVQSDHYRSDDYNLLKSKSKPIRTLAQKIFTNKVSEGRFSSAGKDYHVISESIPELEWTALLVIEL